MNSCIELSINPADDCNQEIKASQSVIDSQMTSVTSNIESLAFQYENFHNRMQKIDENMVTMMQIMQTIANFFPSLQSLSASLENVTPTAINSLVQ